MSELPDGWEWSTLGEIAETQLGKMLSKKSKTGVRSRLYLRNVNVQWHRVDLADVAEMDFTEEESSKYELRPGDLLVCEGGEVGRTATWLGARDDVHFQKALHRVRPLGGVEPKYIEYLMRWSADTDRFAPLVTGSTIAHLPQQALRQVPTPVPPLPEQRRIVAAVEEHFSHLDAADRLLESIYARASRFREAAVEAALAGDWPEELLSSRTVEQRYGSSAKASEQGDVPVLRMGNIQGGKLDYSNLKYLPRDHADVSELQLRDGDLLFNRTNSAELVGKSAVFRETGSPVTFASYLIRARLDHTLDPEWASTVINSGAGRRYIDSVVTQQVGQANVNGTKLKNFPMPVPPIEVQRARIAQLDQQRAAANALQAEIERARIALAALRCSVLTTAFSGRLVSQDPEDEPARALLERIAAERAAAKPPPRKKAAS